MGRRTAGSTNNLIRQARLDRGISQDELASGAGITRQAVNAIESGRYVPNTIVSIKLARALHRRVEDLFDIDSPPVRVATAPSSGTLQDGERVAVGRVGTRLVSHSRANERSIVEGFPPADGVVRGEAEVELHVPAEEVEHTAFLVGCDPSLGILASFASRRARVGRLVWLPGSSQEALDALASSSAHVAGIHLRDARSGECNLGPAAAALYGGGVVIGYAGWEQGLVVARRNPKRLTNAEALTKPGVRFINREQGAGSRTLIDQMLRDAGIPHSRVHGYADVARSHLAVGRAVAGGVADAGIGLRAVAATLGLDFVPMVVVKFDLLIPQEHLKHPAIEALLDVLQTRTLRAELAALPGYDCAHTGSVRAQFGAAA